MGDRVRDAVARNPRCLLPAAMDSEGVNPSQTCESKHFLGYHMNMRSTTVAFVTLLFASSLSAQTLHQATPLDELLKQIHAQHHLVAEMDAAAPAKAPDGFNASAARAFTIVAHQFDFTISP